MFRAGHERIGKTSVNMPRAAFLKEGQNVTINDIYKDEAKYRALDTAGSRWTDAEESAENLGIVWVFGLKTPEKNIKAHDFFRSISLNFAKKNAFLFDILLEMWYNIYNEKRRATR